jgi:hypothetical protein
MAFFTDDNIGPVNYGLQDFNPTFSQSLAATVDETFAGNPTSVGLNLLDLSRANKSQSGRLSAYDAEAIIKESGVRGLTVRDGEYNRESLQMLIERKRQETIRNDVLSRTEYSWTGTPVRALATLGAAVIDPINIASAFVPVVGEARAASMLGRTSAGSLARAGVRAEIGAIEGAAGAAILEPFLIAGRSQLQDDYTMSDSLLNLAFGTAFGSGLHVSGGQLADVFRTVDPYARFSGLDAKQVRTVLDFEKTITPKTALSDIEKSIGDWTPKMREAAGFGEKPDVQTIMRDVDTSIPRNISREDAQKLFEQYPQEVIESIVNRVARGGLDAPFARISETTPESARQIAARELAETLRAELLPEAGNRAAPGDVAALRTEIDQLKQQAKSNADSFKKLAKQYQEDGLSRKQAESKARSEIADKESEIGSRRSAIEQQLEANRLASEAEQDIAALNKGGIPKRFEDRIAERANQIMAQADTLRTMPVSAQSIVSLATPEARQAAFRSAIAQAVNGRLPDVDLLVRGNPTFDQLKAVADRQSDPNSLAIGDPASSNAANERLKDPLSSDLKSADSVLEKAMARVDELKKNLEQGGMDKARTEALNTELAPFDAGVQRADVMGGVLKAAAVCSMRA